MARYIDTDALMERIKRCKFDISGRGFVYHAGEVQSVIRNMPTADVAPKSEVAREIFDEIENVLIREYTKIEESRERITDHDALDGMVGELRGLNYAYCLVIELKKKYTEVERLEAYNETSE